jgi:hypothetical protein
MKELTRPTPPQDQGRVRVRGTMAPRKGFTETQARAVAKAIGLDLEASGFGVEAFRAGMEVELEHGRRDPETDVTHDDPEVTGRIAWAHLKESPDYYERLELVERMGPAVNLVGP